MTPETPFLIEMVRAKMPFGKYKGRLIATLPTYYLEYFAREGFPEGVLGQYLSTMYEIRLNGLEYLIRPLMPRD
ncbi:DUF3820 family protein [Balneolaceae bacterium ANBcel3]|nr:DUF3820 family protein [Balneolaceae bacterium ANBcel3]